MIDAFISAWQRSFDYEGRSPRPDYWWFVLANNILFLVLFVQPSVGSGALPM